MISEKMREKYNENSNGEKTPKPVTDRKVYKQNKNSFFDETNPLWWVSSKPNYTM